MKNILIFKTDKLGDLINISPVISNLKNSYPKSEITLICSNYNYSVANIYSNEARYFSCWRYISRSVNRREI